jgi:hypothetical protein
VPDDHRLISNFLWGLHRPSILPEINKVPTGAVKTFEVDFQEKKLMGQIP